MNPQEKYLFRMISYECSEGFDQEISWSGDLFQWRTKEPKPAPKVRKKRGIVKDFSPASRFRMLCYVARIDWTNAPPADFITLTYPDDHLPKNKTECARQRDRFWQYSQEYLNKQYPAMWRLEWIDRKSGRNKGQFCPHIHMMCWNVREYTKQRIREHWRRAIQSKGMLDVDKQELDGKKHVGIYVAKYSAKVNSILDIDAYHPFYFTSRQWGFHRKDLIKLHEIEKITVQKEEDIGALYEYLLEGMDRLNAWGNGSFTCLGPRAIAARHLVTKLLLDREIECR